MAKLVVFARPTSLVNWCLAENVPEAISGGFFDRAAGRTLGELWLGGSKYEYTPFAESENTRGGLHINRAGEVNLAPRFMLPQRPQMDLLQAGPLLVLDGCNLIKATRDAEGFSAGSHQFDADISLGRFPRTAIAVSHKYLWAITADGYNSISSGLSFSELAEFCIEIGADKALNLDGGGSASLISGGELINRPCSVDYTYPMCRPIYNAIVFSKK